MDFINKPFMTSPEALVPPTPYPAIALGVIDAVVTTGVIILHYTGGQGRMFIWGEAKDNEQASNGGVLSYGMT